MNGIEIAAEDRLAADPELRTSKGGKPWARFRLAVGEGATLEWLQVACFGDQAEHAVATLKKGDRAYIEGTVRLERWTGQDGVERSGLSAAAWKVIPLALIGRKKPASRRERAAGSDTPAGENGRPAPSQAAARLDWQTPRPTDSRPAGGSADPFDQRIPF